MMEDDMLKRLMLSAAMFGLVGGSAVAAPKTKAQLLKTGEYSATAKALVCSACAGEIEKALKAFPGMEGVMVASESGIAHFKVKKGSTVQLEALQRALKASSEKMGMGADYTLRDVKRVSGKVGKSA